MRNHKAPYGSKTKMFDGPCYPPPLYTQTEREKEIYKHTQRSKHWVFAQDEDLINGAYQLVFFFCLFFLRGGGGGFGHTTWLAGILLP